jgi:hypothetical protein
VGRLRHARHVQHQRNAGSPTGRESYGDGVSVVVRGRESRPHGEGRQVVRRPKRPGTRDAKRQHDFGSQDTDHWRAAVRSKDSCPVRRGAVGKVPAKVTRWRPTLLPVRFGRGRLDSLGNKGPAAYLIATRCRSSRVRTRNCIRKSPHGVRHMAFQVLAILFWPNKSQSATRRIVASFFPGGTSW